MNSPHLQSSSYQQSRSRANSNLSVHSADNRGIRRASTSRPRSISTSNIERLHQLALKSTQDDYQPVAPGTAQLDWITPEPSPQTTRQISHSIESFPQWSFPTPPRSDSGVPSLSIEADYGPHDSGVSTDQGYSFNQPTTSSDMSSLDFLLPSHYGSTALYEQEPSSFNMDQNYIPPMKMLHARSTSASTFSHALSSSPSLYQSQMMQPHPSVPRRNSERVPGSSEPSHNQAFRRISNPYESRDYPVHDYSMASSQTIPSISGLTHSPLPSPHLGATSGAGMMASQYSMSRAHNPYDTVVYHQPLTTAPAATQLYAPSQSLSYPPFVGSSINEVTAKPIDTDASIRVLNQRPKPQCWEHGCNGRPFSTFSNLLRHQREKSGTSAKSFCPRCGAEFTRTTARNGHLAHEKCTKQRRSSDES